MRVGAGEGTDRMTEERRLEKVVELAATPEQVWDAIATGPGLEAWFMPMEMPAPEGEIDEDGPGLTAYEPGRRLAIRTPAAPDGSFQAFEYLIEARDDGSTVLRYVQSGFRGDEWEAEYESAAGGWDMYFFTLGQYLTHFPGRTAWFVGGEAPRASVEPGAWDAVRSALGLSGDAAEGDRVRVDVAGLAPVEGVLDYLHQWYVGIRTGDALYRFHRRELLGMPIAFGHHLYADGVDQVAAQHAWQAWLDGVFASR